MSTRLSPDEGWREMRLHIDWAAGFSLVFVFSDSPAASRTLLQRLDDAWRFRTAPVLVVEPSDPDTAAQEVFAALQARRRATPQVFAPAWLQLTAAGADWDTARAECLGRLNEGREWLVKDYARPLVLCLPAAWQAQVASVAPDLWHVRCFTLALADAPVKASPMAGDAAEHSTSQLGAGTSEQNLEGFLTHVDRARADLTAGGGDAARRQLALTLSELSAVQLKQGRADAALAAARESLDLMRQLRQSIGDAPQVLRDLSVSLIKVGDAESAAGRDEAALQAYRESLALRRQLCQALGDAPQVLRDLSVSLNKLGDAEGAAGRDEAALQAYRESLALRRRLRQALGDAPQVLRDLSISLEKVGDAKSAAGRDEAALQAHRESLALSRQLRDTLGDAPQVLRDLSVSLIKVGAAESAAGRDKAALQAYRESLALSRQLREALGDAPQVLRDLSVSLNKVGDAERAAGRDEAALQAYRESLALRRQLRQALGVAPQVLRDLSVSLIKVGDAEGAAGRDEAALQAYREVLALSRHLRQALGDAPQVLADLAVGLERLARSQLVSADERRMAIAEALELRQRLVHAQPGAPGPAARLTVAERIAKELDDNPAPDEAPPTP